MAGGTNQAVFIGTGNGAEMQLLMALQAIRGTVVTCQFALPMTDQQGKKVDPSKVNVDYTPGGMGNPEVIPQVRKTPPTAGTKTAGITTTTPCRRRSLSARTLARRCRTTDHAKIDILLGCATQQSPH